MRKTLTQNGNNYLMKKNIFPSSGQELSHIFPMPMLPLSITFHSSSFQILVSSPLFRTHLLILLLFLPLRIVVLADGRFPEQLAMNKYQTCISNEYLLWEDRNNNEEINRFKKQQQEKETKERVKEVGKIRQKKTRGTRVLTVEPLVMSEPELLSPASCPASCSHNPPRHRAQSWVLRQGSGKENSHTQAILFYMYLHFHFVSLETLCLSKEQIYSGVASSSPRSFHATKTFIS